MKLSKKLASILVSFALLLAAGCSNKGSATMKDGDFTGTGEGRSGEINLTISVKDGKVTNVKVNSEAETDFAKPAIQKISDQLISGTDVAELDAVSGATMTSAGTKEALENAVKAAKGIVEKPKKYKNTKCDIVVIGSGGAGLSAAVQAAQKGADVIVLEKMGIVGGNSNYSTAGLNASETGIQRKLGIQDSNQQYFDDTMKGGHYLNDPDLVHTLVENSADAVDWLGSLGADLSDVGKMAGSTNPRTHRPKGGAAIGAHLVSVLKKQTMNPENVGVVEIRTRNKVTDVLTDDDGAVCGVVVQAQSGTYQIKSKAVIVASGGFGANQEMVVKYRPEYAGFNTTNHKGATGDAVDFLKKVDAQFIQMDQIQTHPTVVVGSGIMITEAVRGNGAIMVNREGKRFASEMLPRDAMSAAVLAQTGKTAFLVFDQGIRESLKAIESYDQQGLLTSGNTPEELAEKLGIPAEALAATIRTYNNYQKNGNDADFGRKGSEMPRSLEKGPYYAVEVAPAIHHTMGGVKINTNAEVLNNSGKVIPGLFAAGEVTGGVHGANRLGGTAVADIVIYGRIAANSAVKYAEIE